MVRRVGYIHFPHLMQISLLRDYADLLHMSPNAKKSPNTNADKSSPQPNLNIRSKVFELSGILDVAKVNSTFSLRIINDFVFVGR